MSYYDDKKKAVVRVKEWAENDNRGSWKDLVARSLEDFGFSELTMLKILDNLSGGELLIRDGELVNKYE